MIMDRKPEASCFRSFSLYNYRNLSARQFDMGEKDSAGFSRYNTLGYFDEFRTKQIKVAHRKGDMLELWQGIKDMNSELVEDESGCFSAKSYQNIFGYPIPADKLRDCIGSTTGRYVTDEEFWDDHQYPYIFTILIQFFDRSEDKDAIGIDIEEKIKTYLKKYLEHIQLNFDDYRNVFVKKRTPQPTEPEEGAAAEGKGKETEDAAPQQEEGADEEVYVPSDQEKEFLLTNYITFDKYDYILCVKTKAYLPFVLATQQLYSLFSADTTKECFSVGSFTVTAIDGKCLQSIADETVPSICIKCSYNESSIYHYNKQLIERIRENEGENKFNVLNYMHLFQDKLKNYLYTESEQKKLDEDCRDEYFRMYFISGENDIRFIARYVRMQKLTTLFFQNSSPLNDTFLGGFSTSINVMNYDIYGFGLLETSPPANHSLVKKIVECKRMIKVISEKGCPEELVKTMHQINSGLSAIMPMNENYRGYGFLSLFPHFYAYLQRFYSTIIRSGPNNPIKKEELDNTQDLMQYIGAALLTTIRSDFKEFQVPTFNANLYYTPTKLLVLYRAFIVNFLEYYKPLYRKSVEEDGFASAQESKLHFIVVPGSQFGATVFETAGGVYENNRISERFFVCEISEKNVYCLKTSFIILSHEISHYGLKKVRNRRNRYEHIWQSYISAFVVLFFADLYQEFGKDPSIISMQDSSSVIVRLFDSSIFLSELKGKLIEKILIKYELKDTKLRKNSHDDKNKYHYNKILFVLEQNFADLHDEIKDIVAGEVCTYIQNYLFSCNNLSFSDKVLLNERSDSIVNVAFEKVFRLCLTGYNIHKIESPHHFISYHYKEVFSDIMGVISLNLKPEEYYHTIIRERCYHIDAQNYQSLMYRVSLVLDSIFTAVVKLKQSNDSILPFDFIEQVFENYRDWLAVIDLAQRRIRKNPEEVLSVHELILEYRSVKSKLFDVFAEAISDKRYVARYREINSNRLNPVKILFYDQNLYRCFVDYMSQCVISYFSEVYKVEEKRKVEQTSGNSRNVIHSPAEIFRKINDETIDYYQKMKTVDAFLSDFENAQQKLLENADSSLEE